MKNNFIQYLLYCFLGFFLTSCGESILWKEYKTISLKNVTPIGIALFNHNLWISDGDHNQISIFSQKGIFQRKIDSLMRPMHLSANDSMVYVPEYVLDRVTTIKNGKKSILKVPFKLNAPVGVHVYKEEIAIVDFYNHRILYFNGKDWSSFGKKGNKNGEFYHPTDVQITENRIYVADAYNHRLQVFDKEFLFLFLIGNKEDIKVATGLEVSEKQIFVTDFENNRVLIYNHQAKLEQIIQNNLDNPIDLIVINRLLYVANYKGKNLVVYQKN